MTDFLDRIVQYALNPVSEIQPQVRPAFAPPAAASWVESLGMEYQESADIDETPPGETTSASIPLVPAERPAPISSVPPAEMPTTSPRSRRAPAISTSLPSNTPTDRASEPDPPLQASNRAARPVELEPRPMPNPGARDGEVQPFEEPTLRSEGMERPPELDGEAARGRVPGPAEPPIRERGRTTPQRHADASASSPKAPAGSQPLSSRDDTVPDARGTSSVAGHRAREGDAAESIGVLAEHEERSLPAESAAAFPVRSRRHPPPQRQRLDSRSRPTDRLYDPSQARDREIPPARKASDGTASGFDPGPRSFPTDNLDAPPHLPHPGVDGDEPVRERVVPTRRQAPSGPTPLPERSPSLHQSNVSRDETSASPIISVTIGRIEVRAVPPPPPPAPRPPSPSARKGLSLQEYLRQRSGDRR